MTRAPPSRWLALLVNIIILALYLGLAYITKATQGFYVYSFLNPDKGRGRVAGYVFGILVAEIIVFSIVKGLIWLRGIVTEGKGVWKAEWSAVKDTHGETGESVEMGKA